MANRSNTSNADAGTLPAADFEAFFEVAATPCIATLADDPTFTIVAVNQAFLTVANRGRAELTGRGLFETLLNRPELLDVANKARQSLAHVLATLTSHMFRIEGRDLWKPAGKLSEPDYWIVHISPILGKQGELKYLLHSLQDVSEVTRLAELERMQAALIRRIEALFAQAPVAVAVLSGPELRYQLINRRYQELFPRRTLLGRTIADAIPETSFGTIDILQHVFNTGEPFTADEYHIRLDRNGDGVLEDNWFNVALQAIREPDGSISGIIVAAVDVTSDVRARKELERVNRDLREFAYVASHDLQEPLRMVNASVQLLLRRLGPHPDAELQVLAHFIRIGVKRMDSLLQDLRTYSQVTYGPIASDTERADLNESLREALTLLKTAIDENQAQITSDTLPTVPGNAMHFSQVFQNLLANSLKYRKPGVPPRIQISVERRGQEWLISVQDNGIGFDPIYADRIFGLFKRLHTQDEYPGTGLGLAICKRIVERNGGRMWAESEVGVGSTFYLALPVLSND
ncbi:MAG: PAS domain-containing protein [Bryobacteraceae bacterium]|nr:PAS domain-containing protein [Bryobacteraceae bacterium]